MYCGSKNPTAGFWKCPKIPTKITNVKARLDHAIETNNYTITLKEDGKLNVSDRQKAYLQISEDAECVYSVIEEFAGVLPFDDKACLALRLRPLHSH